MRVKFVFLHQSEQQEHHFAGSFNHQCIPATGDVWTDGVYYHQVMEVLHDYSMFPDTLSLIYLGPKAESSELAKRLAQEYEASQAQQAS